jgi:hypothetical protein
MSDKHANKPSVKFGAVEKKNIKKLEKYISELHGKSDKTKTRGIR